MSKVVQFPEPPEEKLKRIPMDEITEKGKQLFDALREAELNEICFNFGGESFLVTRNIGEWVKVKK